MSEPVVDPRHVTEAEVAERLAATPRERPRLLADGAAMGRFRARAADEPAMRAVADELVARARALLDKPVLARELKGRRLLGVSRQAVERLLLWSVAWERTGEAVFAERAARELDAVCGFEDWNPSHFLDTAEMSLAVAVAYDWLYEVLPPATCEAARAALVEKGLQPSLGERMWWIDAGNNWGQVCHAGMAAAAVAVRDSEPALAAKVLHRAVTHVPAAMAAYRPDGVYPEGPTYWSYGTSYNVLLIDTLRVALGTDFGLSQQPGFAASLDFIWQAAGPTGALFNYSDCGSGKGGDPVTQLWFADRLGAAIPAHAAAARLAAGDVRALPRDRLSPLAVFRMPARGFAPAAEPALDWCGRGDVQVAMHRGGWDSQAWYVGIKGGRPAANHGHMDGGSFVLDALGERWVVDLGAEDYNRIESRKMGLWDRKQGGDRWRVFRNGTAGHGVLSIGGADQVAEGRGEIVASGTDPRNPSTRLDLTTLYAGGAQKVERVFTLAGRGSLRVADRLEGVKPGMTVRWSVLTPAQVTPAPDGRSAGLSANGKCIRVRIEGAEGARFEAVPVSELLHEWDSPVSGVTRLSFEAVAPAGGGLAWTVIFEAAGP